MIYLEMYGRLGNQFFRYAVAREVQAKYYPNEPIIINFAQVDEAAKSDSSFFNTLEDFNVHSYEKYTGGSKPLFKESSLKQKAVLIPYYLGLRKFKPEEMNGITVYEEKWQKKLNRLGLYWFRRGSWKLERSKSKNKFLSGNFEDAQYFAEIRDILLREFQPKYDLLPKNKMLFEKINQTNSICLSVRRGDFESNADYKKLHSVCHREYFEAAIERIKQLVDNPVFFMFSDDIEWVKENIVIGCETYYEDGTDPVWEKIRLMSACKHFVISNSTFSWWVQYLSTYDKKIVVSPNRWYNNDYESPLIDRNHWELIEV